MKVRANPLIQKGDTLSYDLASFLGKGDVTLEDGLKRLPGISVSDNGSISYLGKSISYFYIEGLDMLGGRYNLATQNMPAEYASKVEVLRHHRARKIDEDEESDAVALNVKLNQKAKFRPIGQPVAGVGVREENLIGHLGLSGMMFTDTFQLLGVIKDGNHGNFGSNELYDHYSNRPSTLAENKLNGWNGGRPPLGDYRYISNGFGTLNGIVKLDSTRQLRANGAYSSEYSHNSYSSSTLYMADGTNLAIGETFRPMTRTNEIMIEVRYEDNNSNHYLSENIRMFGLLQDNECHVTTTSGSLSTFNRQRRDAESLVLQNNLYSTIRRGQHKLSVQSDISFLRTPEVMMKMNGIHQSGQSTEVNTNHNTSFQLNLSKKWKIDLPVSFKADYKLIETQLLYSTKDNNGRVNGWSITPSIDPSASWKTNDNRLYIGMGIALRWMNLLYKNKERRTEGASEVLNSKDTHMSKPFWEPHLSFRYTFNGNSEIGLKAELTNSSGDILDLLTAPVQTNYRHNSVASGVIGKNKAWISNLSFKHQIPFSYLSFNAGMRWQQGKTNVLSSQMVDGGSIETAKIFRDSHWKNGSANFAISKNCLDINTKLTFRANGGWGSNESLSQGTFITTYSTNYGLDGQATIAPLSWMEFTLDGQYTQYFTRWSGHNNTTNEVRTYAHLSFFPTSQLEIRSNYDYVRSQISEDTHKDFSLLSASVQYKTKRTIWKLSLNNLLNTLHYSYTTYSVTDRFTYDCNLMGRTIMLTLKITN